MYVISQLLSYYEIVSNNLDKDPGTIFNYVLEEERGLMVFAEAIARTRKHGIVSFFIPTSSVAGIYITPGTRLNYGFKIEKKLEKIYKEGHYLLCMQLEDELDSGNFIVLKTDEECKSISIYNVSTNKGTPLPVTTLMMDFEDGVGEELARLYKVCTSEIVMQIGKPKSSVFGILM